MPIAFPKPTGSDRKDVAEWIKFNGTKAGTIPAINLSVNNPLITFWNKFYSGNLIAVNVRKLATAYVSGGGNGIGVNPASYILPKQLFLNSPLVSFGTQNRRIIGISYNAVGVALGACTVKVYRTALDSIPNPGDDTVVAPVVISDGSGNWTAYPNFPGPYYFVEYKVGSPDVFGTSPNNKNFTTFTPGQ